MTNETVDGLLDWERTALRAWYEAAPVRMEPFRLPERRSGSTWRFRGLRLGSAVLVLGATVILAAILIGSAMLALQGDDGRAVPASPPSGEAVPIPTVFGAAPPGSMLTVTLGDVIETVHVTEVWEMRWMIGVGTANFDLKTTELTDCEVSSPGVELCTAVDKATGAKLGFWAYFGGTRTTEWDYAGPDLIYGKSENVPNHTAESGSKFALLPSGNVIILGPDADFAQMYDPASDQWRALQHLEMVGRSTEERYFVDGKLYSCLLGDGSSVGPSDSIEWRPLSEDAPLRDIWGIFRDEQGGARASLAETYDSIKRMTGAVSGDTRSGHYSVSVISADGPWETTEVWVDDETGFPEKMIIKRGDTIDMERFDTIAITFSRYNEPLNLPPVPNIDAADMAP